MIQKKICMLGAFSVGKTSLVRRFVEGTFSDKYLTTIGVKIDKKMLDVDGTSTMLMLWDVAGEDDFAQIPPSYLRGASGCLLVLDQTRRGTLDTALAIQSMLAEVVGPIPALALLNKSDRTDECELDPETVAVMTGLPVHQTSALNGDGVEDAFAQIARMAVAAPTEASAPVRTPAANPDRPMLASALAHPPMLRECPGMEVLSHLDVMTLKQRPDGGFEACGPLPTWVADLYPEGTGDGSLHPEQRFSFLGDFIADAERVWSGEVAGRLDSGLWAEDQHTEAEWGLEASAFTLAGERLLTIRYMAAALHEKRTILQRARENLLTQERLEEEVRSRTLELRNRESEIALRLITAAELRDDDTGAHIRRIGLISGVLAEHLGWPVDRIDELREAAPMHDIGKVGIPDSILLAPRPLTNEEWAVLKTHTVIGARILDGSDVPLLQLARAIALNHHEKWDGSGYPSGLRGEEIPEAARIVALADVYDALVHDRPYKRAMTDDEALAIMRESSGSHFEPRLFDCFMECFDVISKVRVHVAAMPGVDLAVSPIPLA